MASGMVLDQQQWYDLWVCQKYPFLGPSWTSWIKTLDGAQETFSKLLANSLCRRSVQSLSRVWLFANSWTAASQASLSITNSWSLFKLMSIMSVMPSNHLILSCPLLLPLSIFPSIRVFSNESVVHIRWPKYWSFSFSISLSNEYSGLTSIRIHRLDLLAVQGTIKSLLQHHSSKASILWRSAFSIVQLSLHTWLLEKTQLWLDGPLLAK